MLFGRKYPISDPCHGAIKLAARIDAAMLSEKSRAQLPNLTATADKIMQQLTPLQHFILATKLAHDTKSGKTPSLGLAYMIERHNRVMTGLNVDGAPAIMSITHYFNEYRDPQQHHSPNHTHESEADHVKTVVRNSAFAALRHTPDWWFDNQVMPHIQPDDWHRMQYVWATHMSDYGFAAECRHAGKSLANGARSAAMTSWITVLADITTARIEQCRADITQHWPEINQTKTSPSNDTERLACAKYNVAGKIFSRGKHNKYGHLDLLHNVRTSPATAAEYVIEWSLINTPDADIQTKMERTKSDHGAETMANVTRFERETIETAIKFWQAILAFRRSTTTRIWHGEKPRPATKPAAPATARARTPMLQKWRAAMHQIGL